MRFARPAWYAACAALLTIAVQAANSMAQSSAEASRSRSDSDEEAEPDEREQPVPAGCIRIGETVSCPETAAQAAAKLIAEGPRLPTSGDQRYFDVRGFLRDRWPLVADFEPEPNTRTYVDIVPYREQFINLRHVRIFLDREGQGGRRLFHGEIVLPADLAASGAVGVGDFSVVSRRLGPDGRMTRQRAPVRIFGFGAGPRAVGSVSVSDVTLARGADRIRIPPSRTVEFGFLLRNPFDLVQAELWRECGIICTGRVAALEVHQRSGRIGGFAPVRRRGTYRLNVRAWLSCPTPDFRQCADEAAWAAGQAGPLLVEE